MPRRVSRALRQVLARCVGDAGSLPVDGSTPWIDGAVVERAIELGLASVLWAAYQEGHARACFDEARLDTLRRAADLEAALTMASEVEARRVAERLSAEGIPSIALKGLVANARVHRPRGWCRAPGDVDLLVPAEDAERATQMFLDDPDHSAHGGMDDAFYTRHHHARPFVRRGRHAVPIELHRRCSGVSTGGIVIDHDGCWARALPFAELGPDLLRLDDVDHCLTTIIHIDRDDAYRARARQLFDLAFLWQACRDRQDELLDRAESWGATATVERTVRLVDAFLLRPDHGKRRSWIEMLWTAMAIDSATGTQTNDALPAWYRQGVFRAVSNSGSWRGVIEATLAPLRRRATGDRPA